MILQSKYAIYSNTTTLYLHRLSNKNPIRYDITIKSGYKGSLQKEENVNLFYIKNELLDLEVINYKLNSGNIIRIYDLDKTICDIIKNKKNYPKQKFIITADAIYCTSPMINICKLNNWDYIKKCI